jgi:cytochrome c553
MKILSLVMLVLCGIFHSAFAIESDNAKSLNHSKHKLTTKSEAEKINPIKASLESTTRGRILYVKSCANCHGNNANGNGPAAEKLLSKPTNLRKMAGLHSDGELAWKISNSRGAMPAWKDMLGKICLEKIKFGIWSTIFNH